MRKLLTTFLVVFLTGRAFAVPTGRDNFLSHGPGAAEEAMGEAVAGYASGPNSLYYNATGLSFGNSGIAAEWMRLLPGVSYSWFGSAMDLKFAHMGLGIINLSLGDTTARAAMDDPGTNISSYQRAYLLGSSREISPGFFVGTTFGLLDFNLAGMRAASLFSDMGFSYAAPQAWRVGLAVKNFYFSGLDFGDGKEIYPREIRLGASYEKHGFVLTSQVNKAMDGSNPEILFGAGYTLLKIMSLRAGMNGYPRFGLGFTTRNRLLSLDLSYEARAISASQKITLTYNFLKGAPEERPKDAYEELEGRAESLKSYLLEDAKRALEQKNEFEAVADFEKILALGPTDKTTTMTLKSMTGRIYPVAAAVPPIFHFFGKSRDKLYLRFAVAFADGDAPEICSLARNFAARWPGDSRSPLVKLLSGKVCSPH